MGRPGAILAVTMKLAFPEFSATKSMSAIESSGIRASSSLMLAEAVCFELLTEYVAGASSSTNVTRIDPLISFSVSSSNVTFNIDTYMLSLFKLNPSAGLVAVSILFNLLPARKLPKVFSTLNRTGILFAGCNDAVTLKVAGPPFSVVAVPFSMDNCGRSALNTRMEALFALG